MITMLAAALLVAGCGDDGNRGDMRDDMARNGDAMDPTAEDMDGTDMPGMDGMTLGGDARTEMLARTRSEDKPPSDAAWVANEVVLDVGEELRHRHGFGFVHAHEGEHELVVNGDAQALREGEAATIGARREHVHRAGDAPAALWHVLLESPGTPLPGTDDARVLFETEPLDSIPRPALAVSVDVVLDPSGGATSVHTHSGTETIYVVDGPFQYQTSTEATEMVDTGDVRSIPARVAVQKRNPGAEPARFLSWFLVDPEEPFATPASFDS